MKSQKVNTRHNSFVSSSPIFGVFYFVHFADERHRNERTDEEQMKKKTNKKPSRRVTETETPGKNTSRKLFIGRIFLHYFLWTFQNACPMCVWPFQLVVFHSNFIFRSAKPIVRCRFVVFFSFSFGFPSFIITLHNFSFT